MFFHCISSVIYSALVLERLKIIHMNLLNSSHNLTVIIIST